MDERAILLWDGECGFCRRCVEWVERCDREKRIRVLPFQDAPTPPMTAELRVRSQKAIQLIHPDGRITSAGRASLDVLRLLGWRKTAAFFRRPPLIWAVEGGYRLVARSRGIVSRLLPG